MGFYSTKDLYTLKEASIVKKQFPEWQAIYPDYTCILKKLNSKNNNSIKNKQWF